MLQRVIRGRITFTPAGEGYTFEAPTRFDKLFSGVATPLPAWVRSGDTRGQEHIQPEDTPDADYGRLLEQAARALDGGFKTARKGVRPWRGAR